MSRTSVTRRQVLAGLVAAPIALARPTDTVKARFEEVGKTVRMTLALPGLISARDADALKSIDSSFDTTLRYSLRLVEYGTRDLISSRIVVVKIRRDPWKKRYVVSRRSGGGGWSKRFFTKRAEAVAAATTLDRQVVGAVSQLERTGDGPYYYVEVLALRNPIDNPDGDDRKRGRGGARDLELFARLVDSMVGERARAEKKVHVRTNPFYLLP
ncbi:MAG: hypothetical protein ACE37F_37810 [Nannocystaceae bacterium]|nr:hypothetical protein [bacterium]